jgi:hypothetical protein
MIDPSTSKQRRIVERCRAAGYRSIQRQWPLLEPGEVRDKVRWQMALGWLRIKGRRYRHGQMTGRPFGRTIDPITISHCEKFQWIREQFQKKTHEEEMR